MSPAGSRQRPTAPELRALTHDPSRVAEREPLILFVEDDPDARFLVETALDQIAFEGRLETEDHGAEALHRLTADGALSRFDLVILDVDLPGASGLEILHAIRRRHDAQALPVVMLTNLRDDNAMRRAYELGANCWVRKPARLRDIVHTLEAMFGFLLDE